METWWVDSDPADSDPADSDPADSDPPPPEPGRCTGGSWDLPPPPWAETWAGADAPPPPREAGRAGPRGLSLGLPRGPLSFSASAELVLASPGQ